MIELYNFSGKALPLAVQEININWNDYEKKGMSITCSKRFMIKKMLFIAPLLFAFYKQSYMGSFRINKLQIKNLDHITLIGCGTSWHAARIAQFYFEQICHIPTRVHLSSEFRYMSFFPEKNAAYIFISQSGETADTLEALRLVNGMDLPTIALTNVPSSTWFVKLMAFC